VKILIAEDSPLIQNIHRQRMHAWNFEFDLASNGEEAVTLALEHNGEYDLCLMDIDMPKMNGIEAARVIRKSVRYFPIMALTSEPTHEAPSLQAGMDAFMLKSGNHSELLDRIKALTVKLYRVGGKATDFMITKATPDSRQQAEELRALAKKGLCKISLRDNTDRVMTAHESIPAKIAHDFSIKDQILTTFLNRDRKAPTLVYLFKASHLMPEVGLFDNEFEQLLIEEDEALADYSDLLK
jgi:DNA-binding response OmpR family regulator